MKTFFTRLFVFFGFLFVLEVGALAYLWFVDPFEIRPLISMLTSETPATAPAASNTSTTVDKNPALNTQQEQALEAIGINPATLPTTITPAMKACFVEKLGAARVAEIEKGSTPTATEVFQTRACYTP